VRGGKLMMSRFVFPVRHLSRVDARSSMYWPVIKAACAFNSQKERSISKNSLSMAELSPAALSITLSIPEAVLLFPLLTCAAELERCASAAESRLAAADRTALCAVLIVKRAQHPNRSGKRGRDPIRGSPVPLRVQNGNPREAAFAATKNTPRDFLLVSAS
jgi:hypothetical protein